MTEQQSPPAVRHHGCLEEAKLAVMAEVPYVQKRKSDGLNYTFASEAALIRKLHKAMVRNQLTIKPVKADYVTQDSYQTSNNKTAFRVRIKAVYELKHWPSKESELIEVLGEAQDNGDKATPKSMTIALKYALRQAFLIETGDDPDKVKQEAVSNQRANESADNITRGRDALSKCKTVAQVRQLREKFQAVSNQSDRSELSLLADRLIAEMEGRSADAP